MVQANQTAGKTAEILSAFETILAEQRKQIAEMSKRQDEKLQEFIDKFTATKTAKRSEPKPKYWRADFENLGENVKGRTEDICTMSFEKTQAKGHLAEYTLELFVERTADMAVIKLTRKEVKALHAALTEMLNA